MSDPLPLAAASARLRGKPGRPRLSDEERARRAQTRATHRAAQLATVTPRLFGVEAAARYAWLSPWTIRDLIANGELPRVVIPGAGKDLRVVRVDRADLDALIERWKERPA